MTEPRREIVLGPPGTGKTTRLIGIVREELAGGTPPDRIGFVTFTRRAATEAQDRAAADLGLARRDLPWFRTIHSLCMRWIGARSSQIMEGARMGEFARHAGVRITGRFSMEDGTWAGYGEGDRMLFMTNLARVRRIPLRRLYEEDHDDLDWRAVERFAAAMSAFKTEMELIDYTDMLEHFVARGTGPALDVLLVDESQDLSVLQWDVVRVLARSCRRVVVAGDDDQAIFSWAGGSTDTLIDMEGDVSVLGRSWRVPVSVQKVANDVIRRVRRRRPKEWAPREELGAVRWISSDAEIAFPPDQTTLFLARNRYQLDPTAAALRSDGVLYEREGHSSVRPTLLSAIVTWERLRRGQPQPVPDVRRTYEQMSVGVGFARGSKTLPRFGDDDVVGIPELREAGGLLTDLVWHQALDKISPEERAYLIRCRRRGELLSQRPRVRLQTIHGSKGGEADRVVLLTDLAPRTHAEYLRRPDDEARVFYVGVTRARRELLVVSPTTNLSYPL